MKNLSKIILTGMAVICFGINASATNKSIADTTKKSKMSKMDSKMSTKMDSKMDSKMTPAKTDKMSDKKAPAKMKKDSGKMSKM